MDNRFRSPGQQSGNVQTLDVSGGSPERFGYSWDRFADLSPEQFEQFRRWTSLIGPAGWTGRRFLDVGCGGGRNCYWAIASGAAGGAGIDVDDRSVEISRKRMLEFPTVEIRNASAYNIPYRDAFDIVFSIGVVHHLAYPERALAEMTAAARPGGRVLVWVYGRENNAWIVTLFDPLRRALFSRLPLGLVRVLSVAATGALWLLLRSGWGRLPYHDMLRGFPFRHLRHIVFDQMIPRITRYFDRDEVERLMRDAGLAAVELSHVNGMSWAAIGTKPAREIVMRSH